MRYNSLRSQLNWHSRQQTHNFKKLGKTSIDKQAANALENNPPEEEQPLKGHQLMWLEKMMKELQQYKEEANDGNQKQTKQTAAVDAIVKEKCGSEYRPSRSGPDKPQKVAPSLEQSGKSAKKIKFEIVIHTDKPQSAKKSITSQPKSKPKSAKKIPSKTAPKKSLPEKQSTPKEALNSSKQMQICCPSNTKVIQIEQVKTDPYSFKETDLRILQNLWRKQSQNRQRSNDGKPMLTTKKSVGKIIRNNDKMSKTCIQPTDEGRPLISFPSRMETASIQMNSFQQYKQSKNKQSISINSFESRELQSNDSKELKSEFKPHASLPRENQTKDTGKQSEKQLKEKASQKSKAKYEKIYIKLQTEKLSQYLCEKSQVKPPHDSKDKIIDTNECQKYLLTNRIEPSTTTASITISDNRNKFSEQKSQINVEPQVKRDESVPRAKSEQRKFNRCAQAIKPTKQFQIEQKTVRTKQQPHALRIGENRADVVESRGQLKLKRRYDYKQEQLAPKAQKLFTLHSVASDISDKQPIKQQQKLIETVEDPSPSIQLESESSIVLPNQSSNQQSAILFSQHPSSQVIQSEPNDSKIQQSYTNEQSQKDPTQQLTLLFNLLDEGHRGLLTDTNCNYEALTEQLKLLFSAILNQIRTKKRFYNMQKFIEESKDVLQIKNEVYMNNYSKAADSSMVYRTLTNNVRLLRKKHPLMFVKYTHTQSNFGSNAHSKKSSFNYGQSVVIDKVEIDKSKKEIEDCIFKNCLQQKPNDGVNIVAAQAKLAGNVLYDGKCTEKGKRNKENVDKSEEPIAKRYSRKNEEYVDIDMLQPQIYLQKKYGFSRAEEEGTSNENMSSILLKTRGYLQNLDSYLKMR